MAVLKVTVVCRSSDIVWKLQTFAAETIKARAPHKCLALRSTRSSWSAERRLSRTGTQGSINVTCAN